MTEKSRERAKKAALAGVGAGVGGAGGASVGVLELAAMGSATELMAGVAIAAGAAAGAILFLAGYGLYKFLKKPRMRAAASPKHDQGPGEAG